MSPNLLLLLRIGCLPKERVERGIIPFEEAGGKEKVKRLKIKGLFFLGMLAVISLFPLIVVADDDPEPVAGKEEPAASKSNLDKLKTEWGEVREQQIRMIREKEDQLEKLKEEIFAKMKAPAEPSSGASQPAVASVPGPVLPVIAKVTPVPSGSAEFEAQKEALQAERQKFFKEMNRQKESLLRLQASLDEKAKQLEAERDRFEQGKKTAVR